MGVRFRIKDEGDLEGNGSVVASKTIDEVLDVVDYRCHHDGGRQVTDYG